MGAVPARAHGGTAAIRHSPFTGKFDKEISWTKNPQ